MPVNYIVLAIPVFILLILLELVITRVQEKDYYRLSDSINDLSCGIIDQLLEIFLKTALFAGYIFIYERYRLASIRGSALAWVLCFLGVDFLYYWFHRTSHEVNAFWAAHVVPHPGHRPPRTARMGPEHAVQPPRAPRAKPEVHRPQPRRDPDRVGPAVVAAKTGSVSVTVSMLVTGAALCLLAWLLRYRDVIGTPHVLAAPRG